jgi:hypothetical protein
MPCWRWCTWSSPATGRWICTRPAWPRARYRSTTTPSSGPGGPTRASRSGAGCATLLRGQALVEVSEGADGLVVGSRRLRAMKEVTLGSVSRECVHRARCPVTIIKPQTGSAGAD